MTKKKDKLKDFKGYWFSGDFYSSEGEERHCLRFSAESEEEAERIFRRICPGNYGWVEEDVKNAK